MKIILSIAVWIAGSALTILLFFVMLFFTIVLFPFDRQRKFVHAQCYWWSDLVIGMNPFWTFTVEGLQNIDHQRTYVVAVNHQSLADIVVLYKARMQFKWVAKASLFKVPFIGWNLSLARHIQLKRGKFSSIKSVYREAAHWLRSGMSVLFFPEGTRSETGEIGDFQNGAFKLAIKEKVPVLPIAINGTGGAIPKGSWVFQPNIICTLKVLPAVETSEFHPADYGRLRDIVRNKLAEASS